MLKELRTSAFHSLPIYDRTIRRLVRPWAIFLDLQNCLDVMRSRRMLSETVVADKAPLSPTHNLTLFRVGNIAVQPHFLLDQKPLGM